MKSAYWHTSPLEYDKVSKLSRSLGLHEVTAAVLARRGFDNPADANDFLKPQGKIYNPFLFPQMEAACDRLRRAIDSRESICIYGDYDVDGITATAVLVNVLRSLGARVSYHLPNRFSDGYGVSSDTVAALASRGVSLLVTVDCGIGARKELDLAAASGIDVIVTDHHQPVEENLPEAIIISPLLCNYPFKELAGVGLAFKLAQGLLANDSSDEPDYMNPVLNKQLDLVALGTIADVVPLLDENRSLVQRGLVQMRRTRNQGLLALMRAGQVEPSRINSGLVAYRLAPRINAAGRIDDPARALELLMAETKKEAETIAAELDSLNRERQKLENQILAEAQEIISRWPEEQRLQRGYVISSAGWHEGVIGIVASRIVELHYRPVIMIAEGDATGKGSGRSIPSFDLHASLQDLGKMLKSYGGHHAACGLTIDNNKIDDFREGFAAAADATLSDGDLRPARYVDAMVLGRELTLDLAEELSHLEPFGLGNPAVELVAAGARIKGGRKTRSGNHLQCRVEAGGASASAIGFGQAFLLDKMDASATWDVVFRLEQNEFNGTVSPQLNLREVFHRDDTHRLQAGLCTYDCNLDCPDRIKGSEFWNLLRDGARLPEAWVCHGSVSVNVPTNIEDRIFDRRNYGAVPQQVTRLISGGESVLLLVADVPRRRHLFYRDLPLNNGMAGAMFLAGSRCGREILDRRQDRLSLHTDSPNLLMADFTTAAAMPELLLNFNHLVFVDPPFNDDVFSSVIASAPNALIHLMYCDDELQFTRKVLKHEYDLHSQLVKVYRHLKTGNQHPLDDITETLLLAGGKYLRQPAMVARCLLVLKELSLISIEESGKKPILTVLDSAKTELEQSPTFVELKGFYEKCLKHLNR